MSLILHDGSTGQLVRDVQRAVGVTADGVYGPGTLAAVQAFQRTHGLAPDGACGPLTLAAMGLMPMRGIDVSHWQGAVDWPAVAASGIRWAAVKVTQGMGVDLTGPRNLSGATAAGLLVRAYHFAGLSDPSPRTAIEQAEHLCAFAAGIPLVLDLEDGGVPSAVTRAQVTAWALAFLTTCRDKTGMVPWLYTGQAFAQNRLAAAPSLTDFPLWVARYRDGTDPGTVAPWDRWAAWQYTDSGTVPGIAGHVDLSWIAAEVA